MAEVIPVRILPGKGIEVLDQTLLPGEERYLLLDDLGGVCEAIRALRVRGAPLLGLVGAAGMAVAAMSRGSDGATLAAAAAELIETRPTAADLGAAVRAALGEAIAATATGREERLWRFAIAFGERRREEDRAMAAFGQELFDQKTSVLTHCNTGALATGGIGTALGIIRTGWEQGRIEHVYATETRPLLQGARLTIWELQQLGIPATLLPDTAAASLIASGRVQAVITGADRIALNGDTANKVGTYSLAAVAARHAIPLVIAAPTSTFDPACNDGAAIPIEFRADSEVGGFGDQRWTPAGTPAYNPAFDVTPAELIAAIVTERGLIRPPYWSAIRATLGEL